MAEAIKLISQFIHPQTGKEMPIDSAAVLDRASGKRLDAILTETLALGGDLASLKTSLETFLTGEADVSTMAVEYAPNVTKMYNAANCEALGLTMPEDYEPIA